MGFALVRAHNLRAYDELEIAAHPQLNLVIGGNATGKTSLLEALFLLARGRSFRASQPAEMSGHQGPNWTIFGEWTLEQTKRRVGVGWREQSLEARIDAQPARLSDLARLIPLQLIDPSGHRLIEEGPGYRRSYLDWGVFHVEPSFLGQWQRFNRALRQRNQALRQGMNDRSLAAWNSELDQTAQAVTTARSRHVAAIEVQLGALVEELTDLRGARCEFQPGWSGGRDYRRTLIEQLEQHRRLGATVQGPHRAEIRLLIDGRKAQARISRGQQKLLVAALVLAQCAILVERGVKPVLLVDDFGAELSVQSQRRLAEVLSRYPGQLFVTAFEPPPFLAERPSALFHVEHVDSRSTVTAVAQR